MSQDRRRQESLLLYFTADWCGPCKTARSILEELSDGIQIEEMDAEVQRAAANFYGVFSLPTIIAIDGTGNEIGRVTGVPPTFREQVERLVRMC